jgi:hypothetical protein
MATYPATPTPSQGISLESEYQTAIAGPYPGGQTVAVAMRQYPLLTVSWGYKYLTASERESILDFIKSQRGQAGVFVWRDWNLSAWTRLYVGTATASQTVFDLPFSSGTGIVIRKNGTTLTLTTHYTISLGTGTAGRDKLTLVTGATLGDIIEADASGNLVVNARLTSDSMPFTEQEAGFWSLGPVEIREVR